MPKSTPTKLATQAERNRRPEEVEKRVIYNRNRREAIADGRVKVGDGKQIDHKKPLDAGGSNRPSNLRVISESENKAWRARQPGMYTKKK